MGQLNLRVLIQAVDRATGPIRRIARSLRIELPSATRIAGAALTRMTGLAVRATAALAGMAGFAWGALTAGAVKTGSKFEQFGAVLETIEGSSAKAQAAMKWVENFAKTTPYELDEVMEAYVALRSYGIDPMDGSLKTLGDTASAMNKRLMQSVEMLADAQTGEFERTKEFGVRGSAAGAQVALTYQKAGREITVTSRKSANDIRRNLLGIFDDRFAGAMEKQAGTMNGLWSNLMDMVTYAQRKIADAGLFDFLKGELQGLLDQVNVMAANGKLDEWAAKISGSLVELLTSLKDLLTKVDWIALAKVTIDVANGFVKFMNDIGGFRGLVDGVVAGAIGWMTTALLGLVGVFSVALGALAAPIAAVIAGIGLLAVAGWFVYRNWDKIWAGLTAGWSKFVDFLDATWGAIKSGFDKGVKAVWASLPAWFRGILTGAKFMVQVASNVAAGRPPVPPPSGPRPPPAGGGGSGGGARPAVGGGGRPVNGQVAVDVRVHQDGRPPTVTARSSTPQAPVSTTSVYRGGNGR